MPPRVLPQPPQMSSDACRTDLYNGLFRWHQARDGAPRVSRHELSPAFVACPTTGRPLRVATIEPAARAICSACASLGAGGFVSFVGDLRMVYASAMPAARLWLAGA